MQTSNAAARPALGARTLAYVTAVSVLGIGSGLATILADPPRGGIELLILCVLAMILGSRTVRLWSTVEMSVALPFIYCGLLMFGPATATLVSLLSAVSACMLRAQRLNPTRILFNSAVISGTTVAASVVYTGLGGDVGVLRFSVSTWPLLLSTLVYYVLNTSLIAGVIHLTQNLPLLRVWKENFIWSASSYFTGSVIGLMMAFLLNRFGLTAFVVTLPPSILIYFFYRMYTERMEMQRREIEQIGAMNRALEIKVEERTHELTELNRRLEESNRQLQISNQLKSQFLANVSHELRTPLNAINGFSELLLNEPQHPLGATQREYVGDILSSGRHLLDLINDILDLSKIEAGKMSLNPEPCHLHDIVDAATTMIRPAAAKKGIRLSVSIPDDLPAIEADPSRLRQILHNLLSNAVKFTPDGGRVNVAVVPCPDVLRVSVSDTGIGIAAQDQERIFSEFLQLDGTYARRYPGTGLGLALARRFVEMHQGRIWVESTPGRGSCFSFEIPAGPEPAASRETLPAVAAVTAPPPAAASREGRTILVVEDNPMNAKLVQKILLDSGHNVVEARCGREAMEQARRTRPDLILMDIQLPDMDGLSATRSLKADPVTRDIPTVALTAHAMKGDDERAIAAGCCGFIAKPIDVARFPLMVEQFLRGVAA